METMVKNEFERRQLDIMRNLGTNDDGTSTDFNDSRVLRDSILIYGGILVMVIVIFSYVRRRFPKVYNVRNWVEHLKTYLSDDQYRFFSWLWRLYMVTDDEIMDECGMDAVCFVRLIQMGYRLSIVGSFNTIWLLPIYLTAEDSDETADITDRVVKTTVANVPSGSHRLYATVFAAYILFGYTMYQILLEFDWYIEMRHKFLRKPLARHFAVFVRNIPSDYRTNARLERFFRGCFSDDDVLEATLAINIPNLTKVVAQRDAAVANLEHALALYKKDGVRPHHKDKFIMLGGNVDSIDYYTAQLEELNKDVAERIATLEPIVKGSIDKVEDPGLASEADEAKFPDDSKVDDSALNLQIPPGLSAQYAPNKDDPDTEAASTEIEMNVSGLTSPPSVAEMQDTHSTLFGFGKNMKKKATYVAGAAATAATGAANRAATATTDVANRAAKTATGVANRAVTMMLGGEDGEVFPAGFVVFSKLSTTNAALQMVHHQTPFDMEVLEAPDPNDVFWLNMSRTHKDLQLGMLASFAMTAGLLLTWTIPMSFFASLSNAAAARNDVDLLDDLFNKYPGLIPVTEQLAPFLVVMFNSLLPMILEAISLFEGPISSGMVEASKFVKLAIFNIVQTFFVSAISGSLMAAISDIVEDWTKIVDLLANALPAQGTYFMQILLASTATSAAMEMLRVVPVAKAVLRSVIGPNLTEKERSKRFMGLAPLSDPPNFDHADFTAQLVLYFMVLFVYCVISPMTPLITAVCFAFLGAMFRGQFIYIYGKHPDSGGKLWASFIQILLTCMLIAQLTIFGLLGLKKAVKQIPLFIPLLVITVLFNFYIRQQHFRVASYLPTRECLKEDLQRDQNFDFSFVQGAYLQPALAAKTDVQPEPTLLDQHTEQQFESIHDESLKIDEERNEPSRDVSSIDVSSRKFD
ncbi:hypothetical protein ACA910_005222 [Epithemia clementina (nom. ined.)]